MSSDMDISLDSVTSALNNKADSDLKNTNKNITVSDNVNLNTGEVSSLESDNINLKLPKIINLDKLYINPNKLNNTSIFLMNDNIEKGTIPTDIFNQTNSNYIFYDIDLRAKNTINPDNTRIGALECTISSSSVQYLMHVYKFSDSDTSRADLGVRYPFDSDPYGIAPTTPTSANNSEIATANWVNTKSIVLSTSDTIRFGDGTQLVYGQTSLNSSGIGTITLAYPFINTSYKIFTLVIGNTDNFVYDCRAAINSTSSIGLILRKVNGSTIISTSGNVSYFIIGKYK